MLVTGSVWSKLVKCSLADGSMRLARSEFYSSRVKSAAVMKIATTGFVFDAGG